MGASYRAGTLYFRDVMSNEKTIVGSSTYANELAMAVELLANKRINPYCLITSIVPLKDAVEKGFKKLLENKEDNLKILLKIS